MDFKHKMDKWTAMASYVLLCVILSYIVLIGTGNFISVGNISLWAVLQILFLLASAIPVLKNLREIFRDWYFWMLVLVGLWTVFAAVKGYLAGNSVSIIIRDVSGIIYFAFMPLQLSALRNTERIRTSMKYMMYAAFAVSILLMGSVCMYLYAPDAFRWLRGRLENAGYLNFTAISDTIPRILFVTMPFQVCGCAFSVYFQLTNKKFSWLYAFITGACLCTVVMTFTRALYLSILVAAVVIVVFLDLSVEKEKRKILWKQIAAAAMVCLLLLSILGVAARTNYLDYAVRRALVGLDETYAPETTDPTEPAAPTNPAEPTVGSTEGGNQAPEEERQPVAELDKNQLAAEKYLRDTAASDGLRVAIKMELLSVIEKSPITGNGFGLEWILKQDLPEYSYLDHWAKTGIIGVILYFLPAVSMTGYVIWNLFRRRAMLLSCTWLAVVVGLMVYCIFQPFMVNATCVLLYSCAICVHSIEKRELRQNS